MSGLRSLAPGLLFRVISQLQAPVAEPAKAFPPASGLRSRTLCSPAASLGARRRTDYDGAVPRSPQRIVCLTEETVETLYRLGVGDRVVGISAYAVRPPEVASKPRVCAFVKARYDKIEALRPDLVLAFSDLQGDIVAELMRRGMTVVGFNQRRVAEILDMIELLGRLVDRVGPARELIAELEANLDAARRRAATLPRRPRVFFEEWDEPLIGGIAWSIELVELAGGTYVFPEHLDAGLGKDRTVTADEVLARSPELILASWCGKKFDPQAVVMRPGWDDVPAVRGGHLVELDPAVALQPGPAVLSDGVRAISDAIAAAARSASPEVRASAGHDGAAPVR